MGEGEGDDVEGDVRVGYEVEKVRVRKGFVMDGEQSNEREKKGRLALICFKMSRDKSAVCDGGVREHAAGAGD